MAWLLQYDRVAWIAGDSMAPVADEYVGRLGREWFCYERDGNWHAVFGKYDPASDEYLVALHFVQDSSSGVRRLDTPLDTSRFLPYARSLHHSHSLLPARVQERPGFFNSYVRDLPDGRIEVRYLPAALPNGMILQGPEFRYVFGPEGRELLESDAVEAELKGAYSDTTLALDIDNEARELPTVGQIFFVRRFGDHFRRVRIWSRRFVTAMIQGRWVHSVREKRGGP